MRGRIDAPVAEVVDELPAQPRDPQRLAELTAAYGVASSVERLTKAVATALA